MAEKLIKSFLVGEDSGKVDYVEGVVNKPFTDNEVEAIKSYVPKEIKIINYVEDSTKTDHRPAKTNAYCPVVSGEPGEEVTTYIADAIEVFRFACPERIDVDETVDEQGEFINESETHLSFFKDERPILARDGDFGFVELDSTGQFNFRPVFAEGYKTGYVLNPQVYLDAEGLVPAVAGEDYNKFKTPWDTGMTDLYRFTKIHKNLFVDMQVLKESEMPTHTITYQIVAPADFEDANIPSIRVFRCADQSEKYFKYYLHQNSYETLDTNLISGEVLTFTKTSEEGQPKVWEASGITYDDATGYPDGGSKSRTIFMIDGTNVPKVYSVTASASPKANYGNLNDGDFGPTKALTKVTGNVTITINIAPPVNVSYDTTNQVVDGDDKVVYGFDGIGTTDCPEVVAQGSQFKFTVKHGQEYSDIEIEELTKADAVALLNSVTIGNEAVVDIGAIVDSFEFTTKKVKIYIAAASVTDDISLELVPQSQPNA